MIQFIVEALHWFDKVNGNSYFAGTITRTSDGAKLYMRFQYGYGHQYQWKAVDLMAEAGWLPEEHCGRFPNGSLKSGEALHKMRDSFYFTIRDAKKRELFAIDTLAKAAEKK